MEWGARQLPTPSSATSAKSADSAPTATTSPTPYGGTPYHDRLRPVDVPTSPWRWTTAGSPVRVSHPTYPASRLSHRSRLPGRPTPAGGSACPAASDMTVLGQLAVARHDPGLSVAGPVDRHVRGAWHPHPGELLAPATGALEDPVRRAHAGFRHRRHPLHGLLVRAVGRAVLQHQDAHRRGAGQRVHAAYDVDLAQRRPQREVHAPTATAPTGTTARAPVRGPARSPICPRPPSPASSPTSSSSTALPGAHDASGWDDTTCARLGCGAQASRSRPTWARSSATTRTTTRRCAADADQSPDYASRVRLTSLTVTIAMANDYNGYIASYREYMDRDHYRKALTGWGPHSSDYYRNTAVADGALRSTAIPRPSRPSTVRPTRSARTPRGRRWSRRRVVDQNHGGGEGAARSARPRRPASRPTP